MDINEMRAILDNKALVDLPRLVENIDPGHCQELADCAESYAIWLLRVSTYLNARSYLMQGHDRAVKSQNRIAAAVRKALGFSYPRQDITF